jgi:hypothetical protein
MSGSNHDLGSEVCASPSATDGNAVKNEERRREILEIEGSASVEYDDGVRGGVLECVAKISFIVNSQETTCKLPDAAVGGSEVPEFCVA